MLLSDCQARPVTAMNAQRSYADCVIDNLCSKDGKTINTVKLSDRSCSNNVSVKTYSDYSGRGISPLLKSNY